MKSKESILRDVVRALRMVHDPEIPVSLERNTEVFRHPLL